MITRIKQLATHFVYMVDRYALASGARFPQP